MHGTQAASSAVRYAQQAAAVAAAQAMQFCKSDCSTMLKASILCLTPTCCLSCSTSDTILQKRLQHQAEVLSHSSPAVGVRNCFCCFWCEAVDHSVGGQQRRADHSGVCRCPIGVVALLQQPALRWRCLQEALTNLTLQQQQLPGAVLACPIVVAACRMVPAAAADGYVHNQG